MHLFIVVQEAGGGIPRVPWLLHYAASEIVTLLLPFSLCLLGFTTLFGAGFLGSFYSDDPRCHIQRDRLRGRL